MVGVDGGDGVGVVIGLWQDLEDHRPTKMREMEEKKMRKRKKMKRRMVLGKG